MNNDIFRTIMRVVSTASSFSSSAWSYVRHSSDISHWLRSQVARPYSPSRNHAQLEQPSVVHAQQLSTYDLDKQEHTAITVHDCSNYSYKYAHNAGLLCLPNDVLENICFFLKLKEIAALRQTCKQLRNAWNHERIFNIRLDLVGAISGTKDLEKRFKRAFTKAKGLMGHVNPIFLHFYYQEDPPGLPPAITSISGICGLIVGCNICSQKELINFCVQFPHLQMLSLSQKSADLVLPKEIELLTGLKKLYLDCPSYSQEALVHIYKLSHLEELTLISRNPYQFPKECGTLPMLKLLHVMVKPRAKISQEFLAAHLCRVPQLQELYLWFNALEQLPEQVSLCPKLKKLFLARNKISLHALIDLFLRLPQLEELDLCDNDLEQMPEEIQSLTHLTGLKLFGNKFSENARQKIKKLLPHAHISFDIPEQKMTLT